MSGLIGGERRLRGDDGSADPRAAAALAAFASGSGSEHAVLTALAASRLLVPVVATLAGDLAGGQGGADNYAGAGGQGGADNYAGAGGQGGAGKASEMALPALVGADGRRAVPAFTSLAALNRWRPGARPVPTEAAAVWRAAAADCCAVVIDIAGPVPLAVEGARLAALARGEAVPLPHQDPDVLGTVEAVVAARGGGARASLGPGEAGGDLVIHLTLPAGCDGGRADELAGRVGAGLMELLGGRLRRGITLAVSPAAASPAGDRPA